VRARLAHREDLDLTRAEFSVLARLSTPAKIQGFLDALPANFEIGGQTCLSVREVLRQRRAHEPPLLMDLQAERDYDHVVALFRRAGCWGAISKTNPPLLRWRDPVYRTLRELAMSYMHEYANDRSQKTLRSYSRPFDLRGFDPKLWVTGRKNCWEVGEAVDEIHHYRLVTKRQARTLRLRDALERKAGALLEHRPPRRR